MTDLLPEATLRVLVVSHLIVVAGGVIFVWRLHRDVERQLARHAWQLAQLVPALPAAAAKPREPRRAPGLPGGSRPSGPQTLRSRTRPSRTA